MPIYYVFAELDRGHPLASMYPIWNIIKVFECDLSEIDEIYNREIKPINPDERRSLQPMIFRREPPNPFAESRGKVL